MRSKPLLVALLLIPALLAFAGAFLSATASFTYRHPQGEVLTVTSGGRVKREQRSEIEANELPRAVVDARSFDFGTMDPLTMGHHAFMIRNEGQVPLQIQKGPTTCKCTLSSVGRNEIPPGEEATITLDWNTGRDRFYSHEATIYTNDPNDESIQLRVSGNVRQMLAATPKAVNFADLRPDQPTTAEVVVYSQVWDSFELVEGRASNDRVTWEVEAVSGGRLRDAKCAKVVRITLPADMPTGQFSEQIQFTIQPVDGEQTTLDLPMTGKVPRRLAVMGAGVTSNGVIDLGQIDTGKTLKKRFVLKVRDVDQDLIPTRIKCQPSFVSANIYPYEGATQSAGLSTLEIEIPKDAPACSYLGVPLGQLHIDFDHPRIRDLDLKLKFAVVEKTRKEPRSR